MIQVIDDFISQEGLTAIQKIITGDDYPWVIMNSTVRDQSSRGCVSYYPGSKDTPIKQHMLSGGDESDSVIGNALVNAFLHKMCPINHIPRAIVNKFEDSVASYPHIPHVDMIYDQNMFRLVSLLFYPFSSSGDTILFNEMFHLDSPDEYRNLTPLQSVTPVENRAVIFDSNIYHCSSSPVNGTRYSINLILEVPK